MSFGAIFALAIALFVAAPIAAHWLRRKRTDDKRFPPARFLERSEPTARRRSMVDDPLLFALRALSVIVLALLGATPFVSCSHVAVTWKGGASVAMVVVLDDSLSMRAATAGGASRFRGGASGAGRSRGRDARGGHDRDRPRGRAAARRARDDQRARRRARRAGG
ncbi:MAG: BatA domain-containing protein [Polyangiaceae bacterium]